MSGQTWPKLDYAAWKETCAAFHLWMQIAGKVRLKQTPWLNHSWHATFYLTARGLTSGPIPHGARTFTIVFDLIAHVLEIRTVDGRLRNVKLEPQSVAAFYEKVMEALAALDVPVAIHDRPNEIPVAVRFADDHAMRPYDGAAVQDFWRALIEVERVFARFRTRFQGKCSPVHLFWGGFDLAVTRFSGRLAPPHPGGIPNLPDAVTREAYLHEVCSAGFWPGGFGVEDACFYSYAYPEPSGYRATQARPAAAFFNAQLGEFLLPYEAVRAANDPDAALLEFLQSTYEAAATCAHWDRAHLERAEGKPGRPPT